MSFTRRQSFVHRSCPMFLRIVERDKDTGVIVEKFLDSRHSALPDASNFELDKLLEAKIPLTQLNSKLVGGNVLVTDDLAKHFDKSQPVQPFVKPDSTKE